VDYNDYVEDQQMRSEVSEVSNYSEFRKQTSEFYS